MYVKFSGWTCGVRNSNQIIIKPAFLKTLSFDTAESFTSVRLKYTGLLKSTQSLSIVFQLQFTPQLVNTNVNASLCNRATFLIHYLNRWWTLIYEVCKFGWEIIY